MPKLRVLAALLASLALLLAAPRAQDCFINLVPNGDFELERQDPWQLAPASAAQVQFGLARVDAATRSRCIELRTGGAAFTLSQPVPVRLTAGVAYEIALDVDSGSCCVDLDVGLTPAGGARVSLVTARVGVARQRLTARWVAPQGGDHTFDVAIAPTGAGYLRLDHALVRPGPVVFHFDGPRLAGTPATYRIEGAPGDGFAVMLGFDGVFAQPIYAFPCDGTLWLRLPVMLFVYGTLDARGVFTGSIPIPAAAQGGLTFWQPLTLTIPCAMGCPQLFAFP